MGHVHVPVHRVHEGKDFYFLGDWIERCAYLTLRGGVFEQHTWTE